MVILYVKYFIMGVDLNWPGVYNISYAETRFFIITIICLYSK